MACALGIERDCNECRMCGNGKGGKKMTNFERIKRMSVEELAEFLLEWDCEFTFWITSDGETFLENEKESAILHEIKWLESECDAEC